MAKAFDPYHVWLGIPPAEQPPHHYRLLGVGLFESNSDVIENAADQRMSHLRGFQAGEHSALSQKLLNEVAAAKICLLNAAKREAYDETLRARLKAAEPPKLPAAAAVALRPPPLVRAAPVAEEPAAFDFGTVPLVTKSVTAQHDSRRRPSKLPWQLPALIVVGLAAVAGIWIYLTSNKPPQMAEVSSAAQGTSAGAGKSAATTDPAKGDAAKGDATKGDATKGDGAKETKKAGAEQKLPQPKKGTLVNPPIQPESPSNPSLTGTASQPETAVATQPGTSDFPGTPVPRNTPTAPTPTTPFGPGQTAPPMGPGTVKPGPAMPGPNTPAGPSPFAPSNNPFAVPPINAPRVPGGADAMNPDFGGATAKAPKTPRDPSALPPIQLDDKTESREAAPEGAAYNDAMKAVREQYRSDTAAAKNDEQRRKLVQQILQKGQSTNSDSTLKYALLNMALTMAKAISDAPSAYAVIDALAKDFAVDPVKLKYEALQAAAKKVRSPEDHRMLTGAVLELLDKAIQADNAELFKPLYGFAKGQAQASRDVALSRQATDMGSELGQIEKARAAAKAARDELKQNPDNPEACLTLGRYRCFALHDWAGGLPLLARGSDADLKKAALADLAEPSSPQGQLEVGNLWRDLGQKQKKEPVAKRRLDGRASAWYELALPSLGDQGGADAAARICAAWTQELERGNNILTQIDLTRDVVSGRWQGDAKGLNTARSAAVVVLPTRVDGDYNVRVSFTRWSGTYPVAVLLPLGNQLQGCVFAGEPGPTNCGLAMRMSRFDREQAGRLNLTDGQPHTLLIGVRQRGDTATIGAFLDDVRVVFWHGNKTDLSPSGNYNSSGLLPVPFRLGLSSYHNQATFHSVQFMNVTSADAVGGGNKE